MSDYLIYFEGIALSSQPPEAYCRSLPIKQKLRILPQIFHLSSEVLYTFVAPTELPRQKHTTVCPPVRHRDIPPHWPPYELLQEERYERWP